MLLLIGEAPHPTVGPRRQNVSPSSREKSLQAVRVRKTIISIAPLPNLTCDHTRPFSDLGRFD